MLFDIVTIRPICMSTSYDIYYSGFITTALCETAIIFKT